MFIVISNVRVTNWLILLHGCVCVCHGSYKSYSSIRHRCSCRSLHLWATGSISVSFPGRDALRFRVGDPAELAKEEGPDGPGRSWTVLAATEPADFSGFTLCLKPERKVSMEVRSGKTNENVMCKFEDINESTV